MCTCIYVYSCLSIYTCIYTSNIAEICVQPLVVLHHKTLGKRIYLTHLHDRMLLDEQIIRANAMRT